MSGADATGRAGRGMSVETITGHGDASSTVWERVPPALCAVWRVEGWGICKLSPYSTFVKRRGICKMSPYSSRILPQFHTNMHPLRCQQARNPAAAGCQRWLDSQARVRCRRYDLCSGG